MLTELRRQRDRLERATVPTLAGLSTIIAGGVYGGLEFMTGSVQGDLFTEMLKGSFALGGGLVSYRFGDWLLHGVSRLQRHERRALMPAIAVGFAGILGLSSYTTSMKYGREVFAEAHVSSYLEKASKDKDITIAGVEKFQSLAADAAACEAEFKIMAEAERRGAYSGFAAQSGPLISYFESFAEKCRTLGEAITASEPIALASKEKMDQGLAIQFAAAAASEKPLNERVQELRRGSELFRTAVVEAASKMPLSAVDGLGKSFLDRQAEPSLSSAAKVAAGQSRGIAQARAVHEKFGKRFVEQSKVLSEIFLASPATFVMPGPATLPIKYWSSGLPVICMSVSLDALLLILYAFCARINDSIREAESTVGHDGFEEVIRAVSNVQTLSATLGRSNAATCPIPYPSATRIRAKHVQDTKSSKPQGPEKSEDPEED